MSLLINMERKDRVLLVRLEGELDHHSAAKLRTDIEEQIETGKVTHLVLNLEFLSFMDSSGLGVILGRFKQIRANGEKWSFVRFLQPFAGYLRCLVSLKLYVLKQTNSLL